jgi:hypothetical protein
MSPQQLVRHGDGITPFLTHLNQSGGGEGTNKMDTNKLAAVLREVVLDKHGIMIPAENDVRVGQLGDIHLKDDYPMRGFGVQIDGQWYLVGVWQEK